MNKFIKIVLLLCFCFVFFPLQQSDAKGSATFVQLLRKDANKTVSQWSADMKKMQAVGIDTVIIQWCAFGDISFIKSDDLRYRNQYDVIPKIVEAASLQGMDIYLGLTADDLYWNNVTLKAVNLEDYFLMRVSLNYEMAEVVGTRFESYSNFKGFYISEEIDDKTWRGKKREEIVSYYLDYLSCKLKGVFPEKEILCSVFFRLRTEPADFAKNIYNIFAPSAVDRILLQDGVGVDIKNLKFVALYFDEFVKLFDKKRVWGVLELFTQTKKDSEFAAVSAAPERVEKQFSNLQNSCDKIVFFSFIDYVHPQQNAKAKLLYQSLLINKKES